MTTHQFDLFGLRVLSAIDIAWAPKASGEDAADVVIRFGSVPEGSRRRAGIVAFAVPGVARYQIGFGREIVIDAEAEADGEAVRLYLLGSALGVLLHQRKLLVLHANAIVVEGEAVLFMGPSGAGKSSLAAWFAAQGYPVLTDDICAVDLTPDGLIMVLPGLTRLRLADEAADHLAFDAATGSRCPTSGKLEVGLPPVHGRRATQLRACYLLSESAGDMLLRSLKTVDAVEMLMANTYRGFALQQIGGNAGHLTACVRLAAEIPCFTVERQKGWDRFDAVADALAHHARAGVLAA